MFFRRGTLLLLVLICATEAACAGEPESRPATPESAEKISPVMAARADFWSFKMPVRPAIPQVQDKSWARTPIDQFILARLEKENLRPSPVADRRTLIRRVSFDLIGLPPTPEEIDAFVKDPAPDAYEKLVDRLLASPRYGERWASHWLDVARYAESQGFEMNQPRPNAWPYRDYVIRSFNENLPYDQFVEQQIAGDAMGADAATGFLVAGPWDQVKSPDPVLTAQQRADELHDIVSTTSSAFLGLTVGCARCHDHKFDAITQSDYYAMTALLAGVKHGERKWHPTESQSSDRLIAELQGQLGDIDAKLLGLEPLATVSTAPPLHLRPAVQISRNVDRFAPVEARSVRIVIHATNNGSNPCIDELEIWSAGPRPRNVALASLGGKATASSCLRGYAIHQISHLNDGQYGNSYSWISNQAGAGWAQIDLPRKTMIDRIVWGRDREERFSDRLATGYEIQVAAEPGQWRTVATSEDRVAYSAETKAQAPDSSLAGDAALAQELRAQRNALAERLKSLSSETSVYAGQFAPAPPVHRLQRGDPMQPQEVVAPSTVASLSPAFHLAENASEQDRRVALARWIVSPKNPLTARVMVNRLWHYHFGRGIVTTPGDFGHMGARPTHPELLDWLATQFMNPSDTAGNAHPWDVKAMQRLIVTSAVYCQSSISNETAMKTDADTTLLWRYPPRRLEAEPLRDAILAVTGKLDLAMGGPGYDPFAPNTNYVRIYAPKEVFGPSDWRRMVYQFKPRMQPDGTFGGFDCPDGGQVAAKRTVSTTPLQALNLLNSSFMMQQSEFFAERLKREAGDDPEAQAGRAFALAFGRDASVEERQASAKFIREQDLTLFCRAMFNANEFLFVQ